MSRSVADAAKETKERGAAVRHVKRKFVPLQRDIQIVRWVYNAQATTREQIARLFFGPGGRSRCQERLRYLLSNRYIERLDGRLPNVPDVFFVGRRSINGLRLMRAMGEAGARPRPVSPIRLAHLLDINSCRAQVTRACSGPEFSLIRWLDEDDLQKQMAREAIRPDAYFQVGRLTPDGERKSGFFLEVERSDKSDRVLREKFQAMGRLYYGGSFERLFASKALRALVLVGDSYGIKPERRIEKFSELAARLQVTFLRFAPLATFLDTAPEEVLTAPIWRRPSDTELSPLFAK